MAAAHRALPVSRRRFVQGAGVAGLGLLAGCGRLPWQSQAPAKVPRVGVLWTNEPATVEWFRQGLHENGHSDGETIILEYRFTDGRVEAMREAAAELVRLPVDVIVTQGTPAIRAAQQATSTIPIVMAAVGDAVGSGHVASLARPGGNTTGLSFFSPQLATKQLELLKEVLPSVSRVAVLRDAIQAGIPTFGSVEAAGPVLGLTLQIIDVESPDQLDSAFAAVQEWRAEAVHVMTSPILNTHRKTLVDLAAGYRLPVMYAQRQFVDAGGLMAYGHNAADLYRRAAYYVDRILKGAKPADLPVEQPTRFEFVINLQTAQALGLTIPQHVLLQATEVLQ